MPWKKRRKVRLEKIEQKTIENIVEVQKTFRRHVAFCKAHGQTPQAKEVFIADYMKHQEPKILAIKGLIEKFNDRKAPIMQKACLDFRVLFSRRMQYLDTEKFAFELTAQEMNLFYNHGSHCDACTFWGLLHKEDLPVNPEFKEVSQAEFEKGITDFFSSLKSDIDPIVELENRKGLKTVDKEKVSAAILAEYDNREQF
jgi:hypothetical protein